MGERLLCKQEVIGSNPFTSTICGLQAVGTQAVGIRRRLEKCLKDTVPGRMPGAAMLIEG